MSANWPRVTIRSLIDNGTIKIQKDGNHGSKYPRASEFGDEGVPFLTAKLLDDAGNIDLEAAPRLAEEKANKFTFGFIESGDVLLSHNATVGRVAIVPELKERVLIGTSLTHYRLDTTRLLPRYLAAYFSGRDFQNQLAAVMSQTTRNQVPITSQRTLSIVLPPLNEQENIASTLGALDSKIQLNHQINQTLEQMAQAIFKSWFVDFEPVKAKIAALEAGGTEEDALLAAMQAISGRSLYDANASAAGATDQLAQMQSEQPEQYAELRATAELFPSAMQDSELGEIPEGWEVVPVSDFGRVVCGKTPSKKNPEFYGGSVPFIKIPDMHGQLFATRTTECLSAEGAASQPKKAIPKGAVCVSCIATVGQVVITTKESHTNQQINSIVPFKQSYTTYLYFRMGSLYKHLHDLASGGSATLNLNTGNFSKIPVLKPSVGVLERYHTYTSAMLEGALYNAYETQTLESLRDSLLPMLLSGELTLPDTEEPQTELQDVAHV